MKLRCPVCHAESPLEAWAEDEAARETMQLFATLPATLVRPLVHYLGLWRPRNRALGWSRAAKIAREVLALEPDSAILGAALEETVQALRAKREAGDVRPLRDNAYLAQVILSTRMRAGARAPRQDGAPGPQSASRTMQAIEGFLGAQDGGA